MAALDLPNSPTDGQLFSSGDRTWRYDAAVGAWMVHRTADATTSEAAPAAPYSGQLWVKNGRLYFFQSPPDAWIELGAASTGEASSLYGTGADGDVAVSSTITLTRDMHYNNLVVTGSGVVVGGGFRIFVKGALTVNAGGVIHADGLAASGNGGGGFSSQGTLDRGTTGANGTGTAGGAAGSNSSFCLGGSGGAGGAGSGGAGGAGGVATAASAADGGPYPPMPSALMGVLWRGAASNSWQALRGGCGGGSGGGDGTTSGGGGGAGGNVLVVVARTIVNAGTIRANGGAGAARGFGTNPGGGGGGGGGAGGVGAGRIVPVELLVVTPSW